jgi:hypothetical protein
MATISASVARLETWGDNTRIVTWAALTTTNNYGSPFEMPGWSDRSIQLIGTLGTGGAVTLYGSNVAAPDLTDDDDWAILTDQSDNNLALSTLKVEQVMQLTRWVRPKITAGDGSTSLTAILLVSKGTSF